MILPSEYKDYLSMNAAAAELGMSRANLRYIVKMGVPPAYVIHKRRYFFDPAAVAEFKKLNPPDLPRYIKTPLKNRWRANPEQ